LRSDETSETVDEPLRRLPAPPPPQGGYVPAVAHQHEPDVVSGLLVTAGMTPRVDGVVRYRGTVGVDVSIADGRAAAAIAAENALAAALVALADDQCLDRVLRVTVYVNAAPGFEEHTAVADGASARLRDLLGGKGQAARAAVGVSSLPGGACVEIELTCAWSAPAS
jgi:enamine deaminase RidA (YjgF/YER057c/UK114 family)